MSKLKLLEKLTQFDKINIDIIMEDCEAYRKKLIKHCQLLFDYASVKAAWNQEQSIVIDCLNYGREINKEYIYAYTRI